jgi:hypothetical protein
MNMTAVAVMLLGALLQSSPVATEPGFTSLFNGSDLTGWKIAGPQQSFSVQDGAIVTTGPTAHLYYDGSVRDHAFRNFELKVDVMTRAGANGGVYVLTEYEASGGNVRATGRFPSKGFEIQVNNSHTDRIRTGSLYHVSDILDASPVRDDEWFTEDIIVLGQTITVSVNGKQVVRWTQPADWDGGREGPGRRITGPGTIALQCHDPGSTVYYRNIRIKPLE